jgi:hypothetical protein
VFDQTEELMSKMRRISSVAMVAVPMLFGIVAPAAADVCLRDRVTVEANRDSCGITYGVYDVYRCESGTYVYYVGSYKQDLCRKV